MSESRLTTSVVVTGLIRKAEAEGGFAAVLARGDSTAGSILLVLAEKGGPPAAFERILQPDGRYTWQAAADGAEAVGGLIDRRRRFDPDLWVLELDISSRERFAAEMNDLG